MLRNTGKLVNSRTLRSVKPIVSTRFTHPTYQPSALAFQSLQSRSFSVKPEDKTKVTPSTDDKNKDEKKEEEKKEHAVVAGLKSFGKAVKEIVANPKQTWQHIKDEAHHYWIGSKLLWSEMKITSKILKRKAHGHELTRRERLQLQRTTSDMLRLVPFAIFVIVPFMELLLPVALKLFPNMLPSTFEDRTKKEESLKKQLEMRLEMRQFMKEAMYDMAQRKKNSGGGADDTSASAVSSSF
jgi:LETM1 and EF-hand domain-containing protein 1